MSVSNLLIIESPNKIKTIQKYLPNKDFEILSTVGHIRDLSKNGMGFDEKTFEPKWVVSKSKISGQKSKKEIIEEIKTAASKAKNIYIATDPDREGEAIAWHVYQVLDKDNQSKCFRITFNEITKPAILDALDNPRKIDLKWVHSQFARRIVDRLVGYRLSSIVKKKLEGTSAGRVQSVALKFIYDREQEIAKFKPRNWWTVDVILKNQAKLILRDIPASLKIPQFQKINDNDHGSGIDFETLAAAEALKKHLNNNYQVYAIDEPKFINTSPKDPYKTSTLQQDAINRLKWTVGKVTSVAQKLYEGVEIDGEQIALISYPRTDSIRIAESFQVKAKEFILKKYGKNYYQGLTPNKSNDDKKIQDAHEAIRIIDPNIIPETLKSKISHENYLLYKLIWQRTIASFMTPARYQHNIIRLINNEIKFYTYNRKLVFDGFKIVYDLNEEDDLSEVLAPNFELNKNYPVQSVEINKHQTNPPPRFNQASLIKALDDAGVGRPSTYKSMANMAVERGYAVLQNRAYVMTNIGNQVVEGLTAFFPRIMNKEFTKMMEEHLDNIAHENEDWKKWLYIFKPKFDESVKNAENKLQPIKPKLVGRKCPKCHHDLVYRTTKKTGSQFVGCSNFPKCDYAEFPNNTTLLKETCPQCNKPLVERLNRRGQKFIGCSGYPDCHYIKKDKKPSIKPKTK